MLPRIKTKFSLNPGAADIAYANVLDRPIVRLGGRDHRWGRLFAAASPRLGDGHLLAAFEVNHHDGPWTQPDDYRRLNAVLRFSRGEAQNGLSLTGMAYHGQWSSTDQVPTRAVAAGLIPRFGSIDSTAGGVTDRYSLSIKAQRANHSRLTAATAYVVNYRLNLFSNFTYFLDDPVDGDQLQADRRIITGGRIVNERGCVSSRRRTDMQIDDRTEWLEADGLGGFASGTTSGVRTRRYHALLLAATTPPTGRVVLVNGFDAWVDTPAGSFALSTQRYAPDVLYPDGAAHIKDFTSDPWPTWEFELADLTRVTQEIFVQHGTGAAVVVWTLMSGDGSVVLRVRPFLSGRDYHAMHHENGAFRFDEDANGALVILRPYEDLPAVVCLSNGEFRRAPDWYRQFLYIAERERGLDDTEDLASPGEFSWTLSRGEPAVWILAAAHTGSNETHTVDEVVTAANHARAAERSRRESFPTLLDRTADSYLVRRGSGRTIIAGYPWFTDWGRDTFIALRGLCLATGRLGDARDVLVEWARAVSDGMLPNRFPDRGEAPEFNSVDASLWFVVAVHELMQLDRGRTKVLTSEQRQALESAVVQIVRGYAGGTRFGIRMDIDGLLSAGVPEMPLTWMDSRVGDRVITPRIGKPVEVQALWLNALSVASRLEPTWRGGFERGRGSFGERFWNGDLGRLADVVDVDHVSGTRDDTFRPNQILAVGGLPVALIEGERARRIVDAVEQHLLTPIGLRSLAPGEPGYAPRYEGDPSARDAVYHQGTVWPWLMGPFVDAWVRVRGNTSSARREARHRFVQPLLAHVQAAGIGHVSELADAEEPFTPRGCPFQAWSLGELLRLDRVVLREPTRAPAAFNPRSPAPAENRC